MDSSWTGCMLGWASSLISHRKEQDGALWEFFVLCPCWSVWLARCTPILCLCVLGNTSSASPQAGPGEMGLLPLLGLIWQPLTDVHYIKLPEWSQREVFFFGSPF